MMRSVWWSIAVAGLTGAAVAPAQWVLMREDADNLVQQGIFYIYNMQFDSAEHYFRELIHRYPEHPAGYFMDAMVSWWKILTNRRSRAYDEEFLAEIQRVLDVCQPILEQNPYDIVGLFFKGGALGYRGRFYAMRESWIRAANDGREGFEILMRVQRLAPTNYDVLLGTGVYNYYAVKLPEMYPILRPLLLFLPPGDKELGIAQLRASARHARYAATEAKVVLLQILYDFEHNIPEALTVAEELFQQYPRNPYFHRYLGRCYVRMGYLEKMEEVWREVLRRSIEKWNGYEELTAREALYYVGLALMQRGQYEEALRYFYKCDELSRVLDEDPSGFMVKVNLKIGNIYDLQGKRDLALMQYRKVLSWRDVQNSHEEARRYAEKPYGSQ
ncbi:MAG: tetratricopeptide repeat protein [Candidatus Kapabacteria bacterium]|nr:tetratricopeptide repeat protein [Candidatus Kapabacteria bacterium]MDW8225652.1 tetratricopeptide repeat protein [Bacteroidota bacterium]